ncbi:hypothetical protein JXL83_01780 [candidate division WOR-3 bacterium]|nr:hypothetical protein [candidate division WOR-3 bacterium]
MQEELNNLKTLSLFHFIMSGFTALVSCFPLIHITIGIILLIAGAHGAFDEQSEAPPAMVGVIFIIVGGIVVLVGWTLALLIFLAGKNLRKTTRYHYCLAIACLLCIMVPYGTVLGVFSIIVLTREPVKELFAKKN